jgi:electron transfer flavoprotein alpha subunit
MGGILVLCEHRAGAMRDITFEVLATGRRLADDNGLELTALLLQAPGADLAPALGELADTTIVIEAPPFAEYDADPYLLAVAEVLDREQPLLTLLGHTASGIDLGPALAIRSGQPMVSDCVEVSLRGSDLEVLRHEYGGKIHSRLRLKTASGYLVTLRPGSGAAEAPASSRPRLERLAAPGLEGGRGRRLLGFLETAVEDVDIAEAQILVAVGRGIGSPDTLPLIESFAESIGATIACSRPVADKGWLPKSRQVGTSGKVVRPDLYIALGISGAYQHVAGMRGATTIIAVNTDPMAPIFDVAHYGVVGDLSEVLPAIAEHLSQEA